jgi:TonB family protein
VLELVIGESGEVESATLREPVNSLYDELLLAAARTWRYKAATKDGKPVRFRRVMRVSLDALGGK